MVILNTSSYKSSLRDSFLYVRFQTSYFNEKNFGFWGEKDSECCSMRYSQVSRYKVSICFKRLRYRDEYKRRTWLCYATLLRNIRIVKFMEMLNMGDVCRRHCRRCWININLIAIQARFSFCAMCACARVHAFVYLFVSSLSKVSGNTFARV